MSRTMLRDTLIVLEHAPPCQCEAHEYDSRLRSTKLAPQTSHASSPVNSYLPGLPPPPFRTVPRRTVMAGAADLVRACLAFTRCHDSFDTMRSRSSVRSTRACSNTFTRRTELSAAERLHSVRPQTDDADVAAVVQDTGASPDVTVDRARGAICRPFDVPCDVATARRAKGYPRR